MSEFPEGFDFEALLEPVEGEARAGIDLRTNTSPESLYYRLRDARAEARQVERKMDEPEDPLEKESRSSQGSAARSPTQKWRSVLELAVEALGQAKDLEVAAWLTEALLRDSGLSGLTAGVKLMTGLVENFWDELYPLPDDEGIATRVASVAGLNGASGTGTLIQPLQRLSLFTRPDGAPFELWQYDQSERIAQAPDAAARQQRIAAGAIPFEALQKEAEAAGGANFAKLREAAVAAGEAWRRLGDALDARAGPDAPATSAVREMLDKITEIGGRFAGGEAPAPAAAGLASEAAGSNAAPARAGPALSSPGAVATRDDALHALLDIAEYFRRTEPLSPLAYTLQETVRRARMNWPQLLEEIVHDPATRSAILTSLGIRPPSE
jgi:type VI secretion system protein ImpA